MRGPKAAERDAEMVVALLRIQPLTRKELLEALREERPTMSDSVMRVAVEEARGKGHPVIHSDGRYRLAETPEELDEWIAREAEPRAHRLLQQIASMRSAATTRWSGQMRLVSFQGREV